MVDVHNNAIRVNVGMENSIFTRGNNCNYSDQFNQYTRVIAAIQRYYLAKI